MVFYSSKGKKYCLPAGVVEILSSAAGLASVRAVQGTEFAGLDKCSLLAFPCLQPSCEPALHPLMVVMDGQGLWHETPCTAAAPISLSQCHVLGLSQKGWVGFVWPPLAYMPVNLAHLFLPGPTTTISQSYWHWSQQQLSPGSSGRKECRVSGIVTSIAPSAQLGLLAAASEPAGEDVRLGKEKGLKEPWIMIEYFAE